MNAFWQNFFFLTFSENVSLNSHISLLPRLLLFYSRFLTWSSLSNPGALQYPPSPTQGNGGSAPPLACSQKERTLPSSPCSSAHEPPDTEKRSGVHPDADPGSTLCLLGLEESSGARSGSGGLEGGGELGVGKGGSSGTRGPGSSLKRKVKYSFV